MPTVIKKDMIQRIQTVYILIALLSIVGFYFWFPMFLDEEGIALLEPNEPLVIGLLIVAGLAALFALFSYTNRVRQILLNRASILLQIILLGVFAYRFLTLSGEMEISEKGIGVIFPIISIVFLLMANKAIKRDEDLVKSVDRLR